MKIVLDVHGEYALVFWSERITPFVVVLLEKNDKNIQVGNTINSWHQGDYFRSIKTAVARFEKRSGKIYD